MSSQKLRIAELTNGRLAMLDGTQLSAMALLWLLFLSFDKSNLDKLRALFAGFISSFLLLNPLQAEGVGRHLGYLDLFSP